MNNSSRHFNSFDIYEYFIGGSHDMHINKLESPIQILLDAGLPEILRGSLHLQYNVNFRLALTQYRRILKYTRKL